MKLDAYTLSSFAKTREGGNPAGVVFNADSLREGQMRKAAAILGFSETAFVLRSTAADFRLRFFTPNKEVDLCGHATIAAFSAMAQLGLLAPGRYVQETKAGLLGVEVFGDGFVWMDQSPPVFSDVADRNAVAASLRLDPSAIPPELPIQVVSTGLRDLMVPVNSIKALDTIRPDFQKIKAVSRTYETVGYHVFTLESLRGATAACRNFAPLYGIPEEAATGTSSGALACYLFRNGKLSVSRAADVVFDQGYSMDRPSQIKASLTIQNGEVAGVRVGGVALNLALTQIEL